MIFPLKLAFPQDAMAIPFFPGIWVKNQMLSLTVFFLLILHSIYIDHQAQLLLP